MGASSRVLVLYYAISFCLLLFFGVLKLLQKICWMKGPITGLMKIIATIDIPKENYENLFGWEMFRAQQKCLQRDLMKEAQKGRSAPNPPLVSIDGTEEFQLLDFARGSRPLVVNFGSCTCPVFMQRLQQFGEIVEEFSSIADFLTIYIEEAHPTDEWKLEGNMEILQHRTQKERCQAARTLLELGKVHHKSLLVVDAMENAANKAFGALPIRLVVIQNGQVKYTGGIGPTFYDTADIQEWLSLHRKRNTRQRA